MKKEAPEQTTLSGQKPISVILDEIEGRANKARQNEQADFQTFALSVAATAADVPNLVKALRIVESRHEVERNQTDGIVRGVHLTDLDYQNITAILNQK